MAQACPSSFIGEFGGEYHYVAQNCDTCSQILATDTRFHQIDNQCSSCGGSGCSDPITSSSPFHPTDGLTRRVPPCDCAPGSSKDPRGRFFGAGQHVRVLRDFLASFEHEGTSHLARLLLVEVHLPTLFDEDAPPENPFRAGFGQEVDATAEHAATAVRVDGKGCYHRLIIDDHVYHVSVCKSGTKGRTKTK